MVGASEAEKAFLREELARLEAVRAIERVAEGEPARYVKKVFLVPKGDGGYRMVMDV